MRRSILVIALVLLATPWATRASDKTATDVRLGANSSQLDSPKRVMSAPTMKTIDGLADVYSSLNQSELGGLRQISTSSASQARLMTNVAAAPEISSIWEGSPRWMSGINFGAKTFFSSITHGVNFFGSSVADNEYVPVEIVFSSQAMDQTLCQTFTRPGYAAAGVGTFPGSAWDVSDPDNPRRLNICFVEWDDGAGPNPAPNGQWDPNDDTGVSGKREYLFIMNSDYDNTGLTYQAINIFTDNPDVLYGWWPIVEAGQSFFASDPASLFVIPHYDPLTVTSFYGIPDQNQTLLKWNYIGGTADHLTLYTGVGYPLATELAVLDETTASYLHSGLTDGENQVYQVVAYGAPVTTGCCLVAGDANHSGGFNIADAVFIINLIFGDGSSPICEEEADANNNGTLNIADGIYIITTVFSSGPLPVCDPPEVTFPVIGESAFLTTASQIVSSGGLQIAGAWHQRDTYGDCWGYVDGGGNEYALLCARNEGVSIIDLDVSPPVEVGFIPAISPGDDTKDVKIYQDYAVVISESSVIQIVDISDVTTPVQVSTIQPNGGSGSHNCMVDGDHLFVIGNHGIGGLEIFDISVPALPVRVGGFEPFYYHDIDIHNNILYAAGIWGNGVDVLDVTDRTAPVRIIGTPFNYAGSGAHNAEVLAGGNYVAIGDEIGSGQHFRIFDVSNLAGVTQVADMIIDPLASAHNCYELNDLLYMAHYTEGVRVWDVSNPTSPFEVAHYDTYTQSGYGYRGCWNVYPYLPSGRIIASDMQTGLYLLEWTP